MIAESGLNDPRVMRARRARRLRLRRCLGRRLPPRAADPAHRRARRLLRRLRARRRSSPRPFTARTSTTATTRSSADGASARRPTTSRRDGSWSSPRTTTRSATARSATGCPAARGRWRPSARCCRRSCRCCSWARSTARTRRFSSSPTTSTADRRGDARGPAARVRRVRGVRRGDPRPAGLGDVRALQAHPRGATRRWPRSTRSCCARGAAAARRRRRDRVRRGSSAGCASAAGAFELVCNFAARAQGVPCVGTSGRAVHPRVRRGSPTVKPQLPARCQGR